MMTRATDAISEFLRLISETPDLWQSFDIRTVAVKYGEAWHNLVTHCVLSESTVEEVDALQSLPKLADLTALHDVRPIEELQAFLAHAMSGAIEIGGHRVVFSQLSKMYPSTVQPYDDGHVYSANRVHFHVAGAPIGHHLSINGGGEDRVAAKMAGGFDGISKILRSLDEPWDGIKGLAAVAIGTSVEVGIHSDAVLEVIAPLGGGFISDSVSLNDGVLTYGVWASSPRTLRRMSIGVIATNDDGSYVSTTSRPESETSEKSAVTNVRLTVALSDSARAATLLLRIGPHVVESQPVQDTTQRPRSTHLHTYLRLDSGLAVLRIGLKGYELKDGKRKPMPIQFQNAVACLFSLAGFSATPLDGFGGLQDAFDVLATTPTIALAIECTVGGLNPSKRKAGKLADRVRKLRQGLGEQGPPVLSVLATSEDALAASDLASAKHDRTAVLCAGDIESICQQVERGCSTGDVVRFCHDRIPGRDEALSEINRALS
jgi:hypothetical protein